MNRRVLIICYYFPPLGLAGVTRPLQLYSRLTRLNYECHVLTVKPVAYYANEPELLEGLDCSRIHRSGSHDPQRLLYLLGIRTISGASGAPARILRSSLFPDSKRGWISSAVRMGKRLMKEHQFDLLLSTSPPISSHVVASRIAAATGVKWVADFRDLWSTASIVETYGSSELIRRGHDLLGEIRSTSTAITAVNRTVAEYVGTTEVITNGFDPELASLWREVSDPDRFIIGLLGTFNDSLPVGPLLKSLARLREKVPVAFGRTRILQVGRVDSGWLTKQLGTYDLVDCCETRGLQPRDKTVELLNAASMFYLGVLPNSGDALITARIYDLLASGRPTLAYASQRSELATLLSAVPECRTFTEDNIDEATDFIKNLVQRHAAGSLRFQKIPEYARPYSWDNIAAQIAQLFDRLI